MVPILDFESVVGGSGSRAPRSVQRSNFQTPKPDVEAEIEFEFQDLEFQAQASEFPTLDFSEYGGYTWRE